MNALVCFSAGSHWLNPKLAASNACVMACVLEPAQLRGRRGLSVTIRYRPPSLLLWPASWRGEGRGCESGSWSLSCDTWHGLGSETVGALDL